MINVPTRVTFKAGEYRVDPDLQRKLDTKRVRDIAKAFTPANLGVLALSRREDGRTWVLDGQHRDAAAQEVHYDGEMEGNLYVGLTREEEAKLFLGLNNSRVVSAADRFRVSIEAGDLKTLAISAKLIKHKWAVSAVGGEGKISAVVSLIKVYDLDANGKALDDTLGLITQAWGHHRDAASGALLHGIGLVINRYNSALDFGSLTAKLAKYPGGPGSLLGTAKGLAAMRRVRLPVAVAEHVTDTYDQYRREPIGPWRA
jgi:hypothetical protein